MDLRQIEYFVALYDERNITKAARRLNVVQPALSMQISRLERTFKTKLFERTSRGVVPTDTGRTFYGFCQRSSVTLTKPSVICATPAGK